MNETEEGVDTLLQNGTRVFFSSPEGLKQGEYAHSLLASSAFTSRLVAVVIDEAHLFYDWYNFLYLYTTKDAYPLCAEI